MLLISPAIAMLHNQGLNRWHPIVFSEAPFPGAPASDSPVRLRSRGHHTEGFESRAAAVEAATALQAHVEGAMLFMEHDIEWDGVGVPTMHLICAREAGALRLLG